MVVTSFLRNYRETGSLFIFSQWGIFTENIYELALSDFIMAASMYLNLPLQKLYASSNGFLRWNRGGIIVQSLFQIGWFSYWILWPFIRTWTWTAQVFFTLHIFALFMKMHSYAFYNGHLSETKRRLQSLDKPAGKSRARVQRYPSTLTRLQDITQDITSDPLQDLANPAPFRAKQETMKEEDLGQLREDLAFELTSPLGHVTYPANLTVPNFTDFLFCPTLCYELEYPRNASFRPSELGWKSLAVFGCVFLLTLTSEQFIIPVLAESSVLMRQPGISNTELLLILAETTSRLLFPFMITFLLVFLVIFEYILGAFAEITLFADRNFYDDWWNSSDWLTFSREWNIPVHHFFRRHVYLASRPHVSRATATVITFLLSAIAHEILMGCITKKLRGYGFFAMMLQMPIVLIQKSKLMRGRKLLNNVLFWCSMILGLSGVSISNFQRRQHSS